MRIYIRTFGCTLNQSDSELMAGLLSKAGHKLVDDLSKAELVIFNSCTVKDKAEKRFFSEIKEAIALGKKVVAAGCVPQADPYNQFFKKVSVLGVRNLNKIAGVVEEAAKGNIIRMLGFNNDTASKTASKNLRLNQPKLRKNPAVEIIPIAAGCIGECSYCRTRLARGKLMSYDAKAIKQQFEAALKDGVKEIWLTSQDCGAYGKDAGSSLIKLMDELLSVKVSNDAKMNSDVRIRLGMLNPNHALEFLDDYVRILKHPNMFKFSHLPVQSGSNRVLELMNRKYTAEDFVNIVKKLRKEIPMITIATDIICGFPTETDEDFEKTCELLQELRIPVVNITKYSTRPGTPAAKMKKISTKVVKKRVKQLNEMQKKLIDNKEWLGWEGNIIIDEIGKKIGDESSFVGRNDYYRPVVVKQESKETGKSESNKLKIGALISVKVYAARQNYLIAKKRIRSI
jgi:threonylcarbamoyladenosine tRNA methylthiotransferase CDKAL1